MGLFEALFKEPLQRNPSHLQEAIVDRETELSPPQTFTVSLKVLKGTQALVRKLEGP